MNPAFIRLVVKIPDSRQTGPDSYQDTTRIQTFDLPCPSEIADLFSTAGGRWEASAIGFEVRLADAEEKGEDSSATLPSPTVTTLNSDGSATTSGSSGSAVS